jgi:mono/diheme cytochrome c family protein
MGRVFLGVLLGIVLLPLALLVWLQFGKVPVAVADKPLPHEQQVVRIPMRARIGRELAKTVPVQADEDDLVAGAHIYNEKCALCHGFHSKPSQIGAHMYPAAPSLWEKHATSNVVGVSDDPPAETFWKVTNGIRLTGMPAYKQSLTETEIWQVSLLLANANKPLPPVAVDLLRGDLVPSAEEIAPPRMPSNTK